MLNMLILGAPLLIALVGALVAYVSQREVYARAQATGKLTVDDQRVMLSRSIVPALFYGIACSATWLLLEMTSQVPDPLWRRVLSSLPCFAIGATGGWLYTLVRIAKLKVWLHQDDPWNRHY